jgi:1,2-phenylacetyl-CoA epoxidase catalytic subunit
MMLVDSETFTELTVHLKLASDAILKAAHHLAVLSRGTVASEERYVAALDRLMAMAIEMVAMEKILRALMEANGEPGVRPPHAA